MPDEFNDLRAIAKIAARLSGQALAWVTLLETPPVVVVVGDAVAPDARACAAVDLHVEQAHIIEDAPRHALWKLHPLVRNAPFAKSLAVVPIHTARGFVIGVLGVAGGQPIDAEGLAHLETLARHLSTQRTLNGLRAQLKEQETRFADVVDHLRDAVLVEEAGQCTYVNEGLEEMFAVDAPVRPLTLRSFLRIHRSEAMSVIAEFTATPEFTRQRLAEFATREIGSYAEPLELRDGRHLLLDCIPMRSSEARVWIFRDVTDSVREQGALRSSHEALQQANIARLHFLGILGHEMRSPLASMLGAIDLASTAEGEESRLALERAKRSGRGLLRFTEDLLEYSRTESGALRLVPKPTDLHQLVDEALITATDSARSKRAKVTKQIAANVPTTVMVDGQRLTQVLVNLLSNAMKVAPDGNISLSVSMQRGTRKSPRVEFTVRDDGPGIDPADHERVFAPFLQLSAGRKVGGAGLGLAVCRALVTQMEGSLSVESSLGEGATFRVVLPLPVSAAKLSMRTTHPPHRSLNLRVIVIDDDEDNRFVLTRYLERAGCTVLSTDDPEVALAQAKDPSVHSVVTDFSMQAMDGPTLAMRIRDFEGPQRRLRIVGVTADADESTRERGLASGMDASLVKPVSARALLEAVVGETETAGVGAPLGALRGLVAPRQVVSLEAHAAHLPLTLDPSTLARQGRYLERRAQDVEDGRVALMVEDVAALARIGHNLRGSGTSFGFPRLSQLGEELEELAKRKSFAAIPSVLDRLEGEVSRERQSRQSKA